MLRIGSKNDEDKNWNEGVGVLLGGKMSDETCDGELEKRFGRRQRKVSGMILK